MDDDDNDDDGRTDDLLQSVADLLLALGRLLLARAVLFSEPSHGLGGPGLGELLRRLHIQRAALVLSQRATGTVLRTVRREVL